jgi:cytochrome c
MAPGFALAAFLTVAGLTPAAVAAQDGDPAYGEYLSSECVTCHRAGEASDGIPPITGWPPEAFVAVMQSYRDHERENPTMRMIAGRLSDDEIAALAAYFAQQE